MIEILESRDALYVSLYVQPGAKRNAIVGEHASRLKVAVTQAAEGGKANQAVIELLAECWGLSKSQLEITRGHTSRQKTLCLRGISADEVRSHLSQIPDP